MRGRDVDPVLFVTGTIVKATLQQISESWGSANVKCRMSSDKMTWISVILQKCEFKYWGEIWDLTRIAICQHRQEEVGLWSAQIYQVIVWYNSAHPIQTLAPPRNVSLLIRLVKSRWYIWKENLTSLRKVPQHYQPERPRLSNGTAWTPTHPPPRLRPTCLG